MKKNISLFLITFICLSCDGFASQDYFAQVACALKDDAFEYAKKPVYVREQRKLTPDDMCMNPVIRSRETTLVENLDVFELDLSGVNFTLGNAYYIIDFLNKNYLPNLRTITLNNAQGVAFFVNVLFNNPDNVDLFPSLERINASGTRCGLDGELPIITRHFNNYSKFIRDMMQTSARFNVSAVYIHITTEKNFPVERGIYRDETIEDFGIASKNVFYRSGDHELQKAALFLSVS